MSNYVYVNYNVVTGKVNLLVVSDTRKKAIDEFALWCTHKTISRDQEEKLALNWIRNYVKKDVTPSYQWVNLFGKYGTKMVLETIYQTRLIQGTVIHGAKCHWYDYKHDRFFDVIARSWSSPGTIGNKFLGVAYSYLPLRKKVELICVAYHDYDARTKLGVLKPRSEAQQAVLDVMADHGVTFRSIRDYLKMLNYKI